MFCFVLILEASTSPLAAQLTPDWLTKAAEAVTSQLQNDVGLSWRDALDSVVRVGSGPADVQPGEIAFAIVDELPDAPGAIAYHDVAGNAVPVAFLALSTCNSLDDVSVAISHECCETAGDPECNAWRDDGQGHEYAQELCDAVQASTYRIDDIAVSDFVLPDFFGVSGAPAPYSFVGAQGGTQPSGPFATASGGYQIQRQSGGGETQVTGTLGRRERRARHWSSRTYRRGVRAS